MQKWILTESGYTMVSNYVVEADSVEDIENMYFQYYEDGDYTVDKDLGKVETEFDSLEIESITKISESDYEVLKRFLPTF